MADEDTKTSEESAPQLDVSDPQIQFALNNLRSQQNIVAAIVAGSVAAVLGALIWALITAVTEYQIGWMAIGVGFLVGFAIRQFGKGIDQIFGVIGAFLSALGCAIGNLLTMTYFIALNEGIPYFDLLSGMNLDLAMEIMVVTFDPMDIFFYAIALYFGYRYAFRPITEADLSNSIGKVA